MEKINQGENKAEVSRGFPNLKEECSEVIELLRSLDIFLLWTQDSDKVMHDKASSRKLLLECFLRNSEPVDPNVAQVRETLALSQGRKMTQCL